MDYTWNENKHCCTEQFFRHYTLYTDKNWLANMLLEHQLESLFQQKLILLISKSVTRKMHIMNKMTLGGKQWAANST